MRKLKEKYKNKVIFNYDKLNDEEKKLAEEYCSDFLNKYCEKK